MRDLICDTINHLLCLKQRYR